MEKTRRKGDLLNRMVRRIRMVRRWLVGESYNAIGHIKAWVQGVQYGRGTRFNGTIRFEREYGSSIAIGERCMFNSNTLFNQLCCGSNIIETMQDGANIKIGNDVGMSSVRIKAQKEITIGERTMIGAGTIIMDNDIHGDVLHTIATPVHIGKDVFIGMHCIVLKGVSVGDGAIIGAGSIVCHDVPAGTLVAGVPCRVIRRREE